MAEGKTQIAVLSGKGGTGKTMLSVNLAAAIENSLYVDCDVEEPNGHLFLKPSTENEKNVFVQHPKVCEQSCNGCRLCVKFCNFNALAYIQEKLMVFEDICHSCGGCALVCPQKAISEEDRTIGKISEGKSENVKVLTGVLNPGEQSGVPIISELVKMCRKEPGTTIIDCPPGSSCVVMDSIKDADYCILVAEPTIFGASNLEMVYELVKLFNKPFGVVLNKCLKDKNPAEEFCKEKGITVVGKIPFDHRLGKLNGDGQIAVRESKLYKKMFSDLYVRVAKEVKHEKVINP
ncbi:ATP-binding protein [Proteinivorax hydrogeniformans]|uniref:ATP-binding protein n=1 Tax=Proteinivorax hydrogeniformans TaxID=1826727 RepID=A0AAU8HUP0_9FIRM